MLNKDRTFKFKWHHRFLY